MEETPITVNAPTEIPLLIDGSWHIRCTIEATELHPQLTFEFAPLPWLEIRKMGAKSVALNDPEKADLLRAQHIAERILSWSAGEVSVDKVSRLSGMLYQKMESIIYGHRAPDAFEVLHHSEAAQ